MKTYVDMDGVIADFFSRAAKMASGEYKGWRDMEYRDVTKVLKEIKRTPNFFINLDPFPQANTLIKSINNIAGEYSILSSPLADYVYCKEEKIRWIEKNIHIQPKEIIITDNKPQYAKGNVLIDDYGTNILNWEKCGGYGIKYQADEDKLADVLVPLREIYG